jgi:hypothetical protein
MKQRMLCLLALAQEMFGDWNSPEAVLKAYVYDNSIDDQLPRLLYRTIDGELYKRYTEEIPNWAQTII